MPKFLKYFPQPLLDDLVTGRCIPFIGAGFSRNADIPSGLNMPLWDDLGKNLSEHISDYEYSGAIDALSAYAHEFSRAKLIEQLNNLLHVNRVTPGPTHKAFCEMPFDLVCTTNFEFLLEKGYEIVRRYCCPIIEEDQLSIVTNGNGVSLLKLHGDLHHPNRLIVTEEDYDGFIDRYPLMATFLASLLISRTALFIGYSLDDPDFRQIWQVIGDRLGKMRRMAYAISVNAKPHVIARFERRGIKVINLPGKGSNYLEILETVFKELNIYWSEKLMESSTITGEEPQAELSLPPEAKNRLCFFAVPNNLASFYKSAIFPIAEEHGFAPIIIEDVLSPGDNWMAKTLAIMSRAAIVVVDVASSNTLIELGMATSMHSDDRKLLIIKEKDVLMPSELSKYRYIERVQHPQFDSDELVTLVTNWFRDASESMRPDYEEEPKRLLEKGEFRAAVISAMSFLESELRTNINFELKDRNDPNFEFVSIKRLLRFARQKGIIDESVVPLIEDWLATRNRLIHLDEAIKPSEARNTVHGVYKVIKNMRNRINQE